MGFFDSFPLTEHDLLASGRHLNLIGQINMLHQHNYELQAKLELAESRIAELMAALEDEREHCAKIAEQFLSNNEQVRLTASSIAAAIRERSGGLRQARKVFGERE